MDEKELAELLDRYRRGVCSEEERLLVESLYLNTYGSGPVEVDMEAKDRVWNRLDVHMQRRPYLRLFKRLAVAASAVVVAGAVWWYSQRVDVQTNVLAVDIPAGGNRAVLKMADGRTISLDTGQSGIMMLQGQLVYADNTPLGVIDDGDAANSLNEIITPRGGIYHIVLEDGTKVWINSDSKLTFPSRFGSAKRSVSLEGEAFFEVAANPAHPFAVSTAGQEIRVLGTAFNVAAYADNGSEQTTLVEGRVAVIAARQSHQLVPGEQAVIDGGSLSVATVDVSQFAAWKSGVIAFNEETLDKIMRDISRWYDVDVHFEGVDRQLRFGGSVSRYANVSEVLRRLELTGQVHFKIEERGIVVIP